MGNAGGLKLDKDIHKVVIFMDDLKIEGNMYFTHKSRFTDVLNSTQIKDFIPITNATVEKLSTKEIFVVELVEVNKHQIKALYLKNSEL